MFDAPRDLVWKAWTDPEHLKRWWAPRPYEIAECEIDLRPGGIFRMRMTGPDGFDPARQPAASSTWSRARRSSGPARSAPDTGRRPDPRIAADFPFTAIVTLEDAADGKTRYNAVAMHQNAADAETHEKMGFHEGWGTCADQLGEVAEEPRRDRLRRERGGMPTKEETLCAI